jgi:hypothetical protein
MGADVRLSLVTCFNMSFHYRKHIATCHNQRYVCSYCGRNLASPETLRGHIKKHTNKDDFKCVVPGCPEVNWRRESMGTHLMKHEAELREALNLYTRFKGREEDLHKALEMYAVFKVHGGVLQEALNVYYKELAKRQPQVTMDPATVSSSRHGLTHFSHRTRPPNLPSPPMIRPKRPRT